VRPAIQLHVKTILNKVQRFVGFVYSEVRLLGDKKPQAVQVRVVVHVGTRGRCLKCQYRCVGYDRLPERRWQFLPLWGIPVWVCLCSAPGAVQRAWSGSGAYPVEQRQESVDERHDGFSGALGEAAELAGNSADISDHLGIGVSLGGVVCAVGLEHRQLSKVKAIGVDEIHWVRGMKADNLLTVIYQIDADCRRLLWVVRWANGEDLMRRLRAHEPLLMNWFRARGEISSGSAEGLKNKLRMMTRQSYGFRTYEGMKIAMYHTLGRLPEPETTHKFC
jgi:transposase